MNCPDTAGSEELQSNSQCATPVESGPTSQTQTSQKKRRGGKRNAESSMHNGHTKSVTSPIAVANPASTTSTGSDQIASKVQHATSKTRKRGSKQPVIVKEVSREANKTKSTTGSAHRECAIELGESAERCLEIIDELQSGSTASTTLATLLPMAKDLSLLQHGCRVIQKAIEVGSANDHANIADALKDGLAELYQSPHGNYVVAKMIEVMPPNKLCFILNELRGKMLKVAKHQYGSRVVQRLLEHCEATQMTDLVEELLADAEPLCRNPYGNFAMQHVFEHGAQAWKDEITAQILPVLPHLAMHRTASHVVQRALKHGGHAIQHGLVTTLLRAEGENSLVAVACSRYGSYVVEQLASVQGFHEHLRQVLQSELPRLSASAYGKRSIDKFGLSPVSCMSPAGSPKASFAF